MAALVKVVELGRAARAHSGVKIRQPLPAVLVRTPDQAELDGVRRLEGQLRDELNVKEVRYLDPTDAFLTYDVKPNLPLLGRRLGPKIPALRSALAEIDGRVVADAVGEDRPLVLELDGEEVALEPEAFLLEARSPEGFAAVEDRGYLAALDTEVTDELRREGLARDAVRLVQNARKTAGLNVSDRIELVWSSDDPEVVRALEAHADTVSDEVLAVRVERGDPGGLEGAEFRDEDTLDGDAAPLAVAVRRAKAVP
jgi:isoleucyl-tRNA synthetase